MQQRPSVLIHIVTWNSAESIVNCVNRACRQEGFTLGDNLFVRITDNASHDETVALVEGLRTHGISLHRNSENRGFCAAHNQAVHEFLRAEHTALLVLNPDVGLDVNCVRTMVEKLSTAERVGFVTPKLYRALPSLEAIYPHVIDAAGMHLTRSCRHFDRGAGDWDRHQFDRGEFVFGGTGACLMIARECVKELCIPKTISNEPVFLIYPQLREGQLERPQLFDEAFFAYREDADLAWRAKRKGWRFWYEPTAFGNHVRVVTPERRASLPAILNQYSVRNRFLLQMNNWRLRDGILLFLWGVILRNMIVVIGVLVWEKTSIEGLREVLQLSKRALAIRRWLASS